MTQCDFGHLVLIYSVWGSVWSQDSPSWKGYVVLYLSSVYHRLVSLLPLSVVPSSCCAALIPRPRSCPKASVAYYIISQKTDNDGGGGGDDALLARGDGGAGADGESALDNDDDDELRRAGYTFFFRLNCLNCDKYYITYYLGKVSAKIYSYISTFITDNL